MEPRLLEILRLGAYQILYMDGVPGYAAVSETVDQVRAAVGAKPAGFANAVLRKVLSVGDGAGEFPDVDEDPVGYFAAWGSHPEWLVRRWLDRWPVEEVRRLVEANNRRPDVFVVPLDMTPEDALERLQESGIGATVVGRGTGCLRLDESGGVGDVLRVIGPAIVQDPAANLVARYADVPPGTIVADLCAAPGGKILALSGGPAKLLASDRSESRIEMVKENARRTGRRLMPVVADALYPPFRPVDAVLLDVPCSGTGTLCRHPDARWRLRRETIDELAGLQRRMLAAGADVVAPGGLLVYSTCTLEVEENEAMVGAFLDERPDFRLEASGSIPEECMDGAGHLSVTPQGYGFDGAFAARMRRVG